MTKPEVLTRGMGILPMSVGSLRGRAIFLLVLIALLPSGLAWAQNVVIVPTLSAPQAVYQPAELNVVYSDAGVDAPAIASVQLRSRDGGPTFRHAAYVAPGHSATLGVALPVLAQTQQYDVTLSFADGRQVSRQAQVDWPLDRTNPEAFIQPAAASLANSAEFPAWSMPLRKTLMLICTLSAVGLCGSLLIRRAGMRLLATGLTVLIATAAVYFAIAQVPAVLVEPGANGAMVVKTRRSAIWTHRDWLVPVYSSRQMMRLDRAVVLSADGTQVDVVPDMPRLLRPVR